MSSAISAGERIADDATAGLMVHSLQKKDAQIAALQDLYAAATTQAASARRQAEAATMLNENLILARTAPHHDAGEDARILITNLRSRAQEQDKFVGALMKRLATLEHFILEEKQLVVQRAAEHVGNKLVESTRRFNVYARKAAEREQFLARCAPHGSDTNLQWCSVKFEVCKPLAVALCWLADAPGWLADASGWLADASGWLVRKRRVGWLTRRVGLADAFGFGWFAGSSPIRAVRRRTR